MFYFSCIPATAVPFEPRRVHSRFRKKAVFLYFIWRQPVFFRIPAHMPSCVECASTLRPPPFLPSLRAAAAVRPAQQLALWRILACSYGHENEAYNSMKNVCLCKPLIIQWIGRFSRVEGWKTKRTKGLSWFSFALRTRAKHLSRCLMRLCIRFNLL